MRFVDTESENALKVPEYSLTFKNPIRGELLVEEVARAFDALKGEFLPDSEILYRSENLSDRSGRNFIYLHAWPDSDFSDNHQDGMNVERLKQSEFNGFYTSGLSYEKSFINGYVISSLWKQDILSEDSIIRPGIGISKSL